jgi:Cu/Ag efflux protein CusF
LTLRDGRVSADGLFAGIYATGARLAVPDGTPGVVQRPGSRVIKKAPKDNPIMKRLIASAALLAVSALASAQALVAGEVKKIDKPAGRITLKHAEIKVYDMPGMTGAYKVQDPSMLDSVQVGDHVQFSLDRVDSVYTITKITVQK